MSRVRASFEPIYYRSGIFYCYKLFFLIMMLCVSACSHVFEQTSTGTSASCASSPTDIAFRALSTEYVKAAQHSTLQLATRMLGAALNLIVVRERTAQKSDKPETVPGARELVQIVREIEKKWNKREGSVLFFAAAPLETLDMSGYDNDLYKAATTNTQRDIVPFKLEDNTLGVYYGHVEATDHATLSWTNVTEWEKRAVEYVGLALVSVSRGPTQLEFVAGENELLDAIRIQYNRLLEENAQK